MVIKCSQFKFFDDSLLKTKRFVFENEQSKEKAPKESAVPDEEKIDARKTEARKEVDAIYELDDYKVYNFRSLPQDFKDRMKKNFGQWIDGNISKYDKDSNSGIDAAEYKTFKEELTKKVREILDRLAELKKEKKAEAEKTKENAEAAAEAQKRLKGVDVTKIDTANMETADGVYTELLKYQKDFENEAEDFGKLAVTFGDAKQKVDDANKPHNTGATAVGEYLVSLAPWTEDIPEVKAAKEAKENAVKDFQTKLTEMKKKQKERQKRGDDLNGAPEKVKAKTEKKYKEARDKVTENLSLAKKKKAENDKKKKEAEDRIVQNEKARQDIQHQYDVMVSKMRMVAERKKEMEEKTGEVEKAEEGLAAAKGEVEKRKQEGNAAPANVVQQIDEGQRKASDAAHQLREGSQGVAGEQIKMDSTLSGMQGQLSKLIADTSRTKRAQTEIIATDKSVTATITQLDENLKTINEGEKAELAMIDSLDESISGTVLEVDTSNFELIKKAESYLKMLKQMDIKGPGLIDTAGAALSGIPGVEAGSSWVSKKAGATWDWAKKAPVLGAAIEIVGYMGEGWVKAWDAIGSGLTWVGDKMHLQEAWDWMSEASKHLSIGNPTGNNLVDTILDTFSGGGLGTIIEVFAGVTEGCKDLIQGLGMMVRNPIDAVKGIGHLINHPGMIVDALLQKDKWDKESTSKIIGRMMVDVVATLSGAGATATAVKTSIAAVKIGGMGVGRAALMGARTFVEVFIKDISGVVVGVVKLPATLAKGAGNLALTIARGGKKLEVVEGAATANAKKVVTAEEAYKAIEATRGKPAEFQKIVREHPEYLDLHRKYAKEIGKPVKADTGKKVAPDKKGEKTTSATVTESKPVKKKTSDEAPAKPKKEEPSEGKAKSSVDDSSTKPAGKLGKENAERKSKERFSEAEEAAALQAKPDFSPKPRTPERRNLVAKIETSAAGSKPLQAAAKKMNPNEFYRLLEALPDEELRLLHSSLENLDATLIERILKQEYQFVRDSKGNKVRYYVGETLGEGGFGIVSDCAYVVGDGSRLETAAMKRPKNVEAMSLEIHDIAKMLDEGKLSAAEIERLQGKIAAKRAKLAEMDNAIDLRMQIRKLDEQLKTAKANTAEAKKIQDQLTDARDRLANIEDTNKKAKVIAEEISQLEEWLHSKSLTEEMKTSLRSRMASMNFELDSIRRIFDNERTALQAVIDFPDSTGLIKPRLVSKPGSSPVIIFEKVEGAPGKDISLKGRLYAGENPHSVLSYFLDSLEGLDRLHENGWIHLDYKPENVFVGKSHGTEGGFLGDLSLTSVEEISQLRVIPTGPKGADGRSQSYAVVRMSPTGSISDSRQIGITPSYFSAEHINEMIAQAKRVVAEAKAAGTPVPKMPKEILALADKNQVGVSLQRYKKALTENKSEWAKKWGVSEGVIDSAIAELDALSTRLMDAHDAITITETIEKLNAIKKRFQSASESPGVHVSH